MFCNTYHLVGLCPQVVGAISGSWIVTVAVCKQDGGTHEEQLIAAKVSEQFCGKIKCLGMEYF